MNGSIFDVEMLTKIAEGGIGLEGLASQAENNSLRAMVTIKR